jgi:hypothetical protein
LTWLDCDGVLPRAASGAAKSLPSVQDVPCPHPRGPVEGAPSGLPLPELPVALTALRPLQATRLAVSAIAKNQGRASTLSLLGQIMTRSPVLQWAGPRKRVTPRSTFRNSDPGSERDQASTFGARVPSAPAPSEPDAPADDDDVPPSRDALPEAATAVRSSRNSGFDVRWLADDIW